MLGRSSRPRKIGPVPNEGEHFNPNDLKSGHAKPGLPPCSSAANVSPGPRSKSLWARRGGSHATSPTSALYPSSVPPLPPGYVRVVPSLLYLPSSEKIWIDVWPSRRFDEVEPRPSRQATPYGKSRNGIGSDEYVYGVVAADRAGIDGQPRRVVGDPLVDVG